MTLAPGVNELEVVCVFGGISLLVPHDWNVKVEVFNIFGGYEDKRNPAQIDVNKTLLMKNGDKIRASQEGYKRLRGVFS